MNNFEDNEGKGINRRNFLLCSAGAAAVALTAGPLQNVFAAESVAGPASNDIVDQLIRGAIEMHVHGSPDVIPRKSSELRVARAYKAAGLDGIMFKCHVATTTSRAATVQEALGDFKVFGGIVLNKMVGGLNPAAVETELALGAKQVWLPTVSAENHVKFEKHNINKAVKLTDEKGLIRPELIDILDLIAKKDVILGTGHITSDECEKVVVLAKERGVKRILITHPEYVMPGMSIDVQKKLASKGVMFERCFYASNSFQKLMPEVIAKQIKAVGADVSIMASDFGQTFNDEPLVGFKRYIRAMLGFGISPKEIEMMISLNPKRMLGV